MPKTEISVTVERSLVRECDRQARGGSRSRGRESARAAGLRDRRRRSLEEEIERYYASLSARERKEDSRWAELAGRSLGDVWKRIPSPNGDASTGWRFPGSRTGSSARLWSSP